MSENLEPREELTPEPPTPVIQPTDNTEEARLVKLAQEVETLTKALEKQQARTEAQEKVARDARLTTCIQSALNEYKVLYPEVLDLLKAKYSGAVEKKGKFYVDDGSLEDSLKAFFETPLGSHLLPAPSAGTGVPPVSDRPGSSDSFLSDLMAAFI